MNERHPLRVLGLAVPVLMVACAQQAPAPAAPPPPGECAAQSAQGLQGRLFNTELQAEAQRLSGARAVRVIRPGQAVTMDFNARRLNIELDASDRVARLRCG